MMTHTESVSCTAHVHSECSLPGCDCNCHFFKPRAQLPISRALLLALVLWLALALFFWLMFYAVNLVTQS